MNTSAPANYVIRIDGHLSEHCSASLVDMTHQRHRPSGYLRPGVGMTQRFPSGRTRLVS